MIDNEERKKIRSLASQFCKDKVALRDYDPGILLLPSIEDYKEETSFIEAYCKRGYFLGALVLFESLNICTSTCLDTTIPPIKMHELSTERVERRSGMLRSGSYGWSDDGTTMEKARKEWCGIGCETGEDYLELVGKWI